jgi:hypothetical protein
MFGDKVSLSYDEEGKRYRPRSQSEVALSQSGHFNSPPGVFKSESLFTRAPTTQAEFFKYGNYHLLVSTSSYCEQSTGVVLFIVIK